MLNLKNDLVLKDSIPDFHDFKVNIDISFKGLRKGGYGQFVSPQDVFKINRLYSLQKYQ